LRSHRAAHEVAAAIWAALVMVDSRRRRRLRTTLWLYNFQSRLFLDMGSSRNLPVCRLYEYSGFSPRPVVIPSESRLGWRGFVHRIKR
jgi:hypothetical protein